MTFLCSPYQDSVNKVLEKEDFVICSFGEKYYHGCALTSGLSIFALVALALRSHRIGTLNVKKAVETMSSVKVQQKVDLLEKYAPSRASASSPAGNPNFISNQDFYKQQMVFTKQMHYTDIASWLMIRFAAFSATIQFTKFVAAWYRCGEFAYDRELAEETSKTVLENYKKLSDYEQLMSDRKITDKDLVLLETAIRVQGMDDFHKVAWFERYEEEKEERREHQQEGQNSNNDVNGNSTSEKSSESISSKLDNVEEDLPPGVVVLNELDTMTGRIGSFSRTSASPAAIHAEKQKFYQNRQRELAQKEMQSMPTFWDGCVVGIFGTVVDCDAPRKPMMTYLDGNGGRKKWNERLL